MFYHPAPFSSPVVKSYRKVHRRLDIILENLDFVEKKVLDLGCSGGFFSFELSTRAKWVIGIDGDKQVIEDASAYAKKRGIENLRFECHSISPDLIREMKPVDVVLFLSVLHHMITDSKVYRWNNRCTGLAAAIAILKELSIKCQKLVFEIGQSDEIVDWASKLEEMKPDPPSWVIANLLEPAGFTNIKIIDPPEWSGLIGKLKKSLHHANFDEYLSGEKLYSRVLRRLLSWDTRDARYMFIADGQTPTIE